VIVIDDGNQSRLSERRSPMNKDKYVALEVDQATIIAHVIDGRAEFLMETFLQTKADAIQFFFRGLDGRVHVVFEEGCTSGWLYEIVRPLVATTVVCDPRKNKLIQSGNKGDRVDARKLAKLLRLGEVESVYHGDKSIKGLKDLVQGYDRLVRDRSRTMNRLKGVFRGRAIRCRGQSVYSQQTREEWIGKLDSEPLRARADLLYKQIRSLSDLTKEAEKAMLDEARKHAGYKLQCSVPGLGAIRAATVIATVGTPHRFRTKRQYWAYCGFAVVTHMTGEYEIVDGRRQRKKKPLQTRGLNKNYNRMLKAVYKGAAITAIKKEPFNKYYQRLIDNKMRKEMAQLTVARKIAAISLAVWKKGEKFDPKKVNQAEQSAGDQRR
jgi:transposase